MRYYVGRRAIEERNGTMRQRSSERRIKARLRDQQVILQGRRGARRWGVVRRSEAHGIAERPIAPVHTLWRMVRSWLDANTFAPRWLPQRWHIPGAPYAIAALLEVAAALVTLLLFAVFPSYAFPGTVELLVVFLVAISMGGGPSLVSTLAGLACLELFVMPNLPAGGLHFPQDTAQLVIFLIAGLVISLAAGGAERTRQRLQREQEAARVRELAAHEMNQRVDEFLSILSHELRSPLAGIKAALQLLNRRLTRLAEREKAERPEAARRMEQTLSTLAIAEREVERQNRLIGDLLDISRIRAGKLDYHMTPADLVPLLRDATEAQRLAWPDRAITLTAPETPVPVCVDADRIGQVITNFLTNALKYAPNNQPIEITLTRSAGSARVAVRDRGPGLSREQQAHIWDRFHRVPGIHQQGGSAGLGLGLYICKNIIEHHGGVVGVESTPGHGATFWFTLPLECEAVLLA